MATKVFCAEHLHKVSPYNGFKYNPDLVDLQGWPYYRPCVFELILKTIRPKLIVDIGSWKGAAAIDMAELSEAKGYDPKIVCIDTWLGAPENWQARSNPGPYSSLKLKNGLPRLYYTFLNNVVSKGLQDIIIPFPATPLVAAEWFKKKKIYPDIIYIDTTSEYVPMLHYIRAWFELLNVGGSMFGNDHLPWHTGVTQAVQQCAKELQGFKYIGGNQGKWIVQKAP